MFEKFGLSLATGAVVALCFRWRPAAPGFKQGLDPFLAVRHPNRLRGVQRSAAQGRTFLGGIMRHAIGMAAITNPTVNSYKRINAPRTMSGATWAPNTVTWTGNNRTHMVRVPGPGRFELRLPDGAANPYLLQSIIIAAGLSGVKTQADPGKRHDIDMYAEGHTITDAPRLPLNLLDALRQYEADPELMSAMGEGFSRAYLKLKHQEWNAFTSATIVLSIQTSCIEEQQSKC